MGTCEKFNAIWQNIKGEFNLEKYIVCMTARLDIMPKTTEQNRIVCTSKSEAEVTNNIKTALDYYWRNEANYWLTRSIARPLCDNRASCLSCLSGMHDWLLWWQQKGSPASDWLSSVLYEYVGEEDLEVKHQAGNQVKPLSDIHCASALHKSK